MDSNDESKAEEPRDPRPLAGSLDEAMEIVRRGQERARQRQAQTPTSAPRVDWTTGEPQRWLDETLKRADVPPEYRDADISRCRVPEGVQRWADHAPALLRDGRGETIFGPTGTGKSSTAALIAAEAAKVRARVLWRYVPDLCDQLLENSRQRAHVVRQISAPDLVIFDDFGVRPFSDFEVGILDQIFENRYRRRRSCIITTNMTPERLQDDHRLGRMIDRWRQTCSGIIIRGKSMRSTT